MRPNVHEVEAIVDFARERQIPVVQFHLTSGRARIAGRPCCSTKTPNPAPLGHRARRAEQLHGERTCCRLHAGEHHRAGRPYQCTIGSQLPGIDPEGNVYPARCFPLREEFSLGSLKAIAGGDDRRGALRGIKQLNRDRPAGIAVTAAGGRSTAAAGTGQCRAWHGPGRACLQHAETMDRRAVRPPVRPRPRRPAAPCRSPRCRGRCIRHTGSASPKNRTTLWAGSRFRPPSLHEQENMLGHPADNYPRAGLCSGPALIY